MSYSALDDFWMRVARGQISEYTAYHRFGSYESVGTTFVPLARAGVYQTPTAAAALEVVSTSANDAAAGTGARTVTITGLDATWTEITEVVTLNGIAAVATINNFIRAYNMEVTTSGTYGTSAAGSHAGTITLRGAGGGATWLQIYAGTYPRSDSQCGVFTVPTGKAAIIKFHYFSSESSKPATIIFMARKNANTVAAPYSPVTTEFELDGIVNFASLLDNAAPEGPYIGPCDLGFMARLSTGTGAVTVAYEVILYTP